MVRYAMKMRTVLAGVALVFAGCAKQATPKTSSAERPERPASLSEPRPGRATSPSEAGQEPAYATNLEMAEVYGDWALDPVDEMAEMLRALDLALADPPPDDEAIRVAALSDEGMEVVQAVMLAQAFGGDEAIAAFRRMADDLRSLRLTITDGQMILKGQHIDERVDYTLKGTSDGVILLEVEGDDGPRPTELRLDRGRLELRELDEDAGPPMRFRRP